MRLHVCDQRSRVWTVLQVHGPATSLSLLGFHCALHNSKAVNTAAEHAAVPLCPVRIGGVGPDRRLLLRGRVSKKSSICVNRKVVIPAAL